MNRGFGLSAQQIASLGSDLISHLKEELRDTVGREDWSKGNFEALRSFKPAGYEIVCSPSGGTPDATERPRGEFLTLDFIADVNGKGILIAAESEWLNNPVRRITEDFEKLLYVKSLIKVMICRIDDRVSSADVCADVLTTMHETCSEYSPGELYIVYCRKLSVDGISGDEVFRLQISGDPISGFPSVFERA